jgi:hypothetical protein
LKLILVLLSQHQVMLASPATLDAAKVFVFELASLDALIAGYLASLAPTQLPP